MPARCEPGRVHPCYHIALKLPQPALDVRVLQAATVPQLAPEPGNCGDDGPDLGLAVRVLRATRPGCPAQGALPVVPPARGQARVVLGGDKEKPGTVMPSSVSE